MVKTISDVEVFAKRVFVRADLDVPLDFTQETGAQSTRLGNLKETIDILEDAKASQIIIAGHIGRPKGNDSAFSTKQLVPHLEKILGKKVFFKSSFEENIEGDILLLENLRFWPGEVAKDVEFAKKLAGLADIYVNEAFGNSHRDHASMALVPTFLPHAAGAHLRREVMELAKLADLPTRPFVALVGGAKIDTKLPVIVNLSKIADTVLVGGELPIEIEREADKFAGNVIVGQLNAEQKDLSAETIDDFKRRISTAKTIVWNGPMGLYEEGFSKGTQEIAQAIVDSGAYCVVGGGETTHFLEMSGLINAFSFVSSGGGAMLEFLAGKELPGIAALE